MDLEITLTLTCPHCGFAMNQVEIEDEEDFGTNTFCNSCGQAFQIPEQSALEPQHEAPEPEPTEAGVYQIQESERLRWRFPGDEAETETARHPLLNSPAVDADGRLYACLQNEVVALSALGDEPEVLWKFPAGRLIPGSPALGPDGKLRVHSLDGLLYCLTKDGELAFDAPARGRPLGFRDAFGRSRRQHLDLCFDRGALEGRSRRPDGEPGVSQKPRAVQFHRDSF